MQTLHGSLSVETDRLPWTGRGPHVAGSGIVVSSAFRLRPRNGFIPNFVSSSARIP